MTPSQWHWQEPGTSWRGCGIYHITLVQSDRSVPILGQLTECADPADAEVERTELGNAIIHCVAQIPQHHSEIKLLQYTLMPDHIHFIVHVTRQMQMGIMTAVRGFWQGSKAAYRLAVFRSAYCVFHSGYYLAKRTKEPASGQSLP